MISESNLIGWLCQLRYQFSCDSRDMRVPDSVTEEFVRRGWLKEPEALGFDELSYGRITEKGAAICDLNDPEWGIEYAEADSE